VSAFGLSISYMTLAEAAAHIANGASKVERLEYVVTPNIDHIVNLYSDPQFKEAYAGASLVVADGWPVVLGARLLGEPVPERVSGSDLIPEILHYANQRHLPLSVFVLGGMGDVPERAAQYIAINYPNLKIAGFLSPPFGFEKNSEKNLNVCAAVQQSGANFIIVGLGSPKQEKWIYSSQGFLPPSIAVCGGAAVDFLAGSITRAPKWVQTIHLEWLYRLIQEPKRLTRRYLRDAVRFPLIFTAELAKKIFQELA